MSEDAARLNGTPPPANPGVQVKEWAILPPGPIHKSRRVMLTRFLQSNPAFAQEPGARWKLYPEKVPTDNAAAKRRPVQPGRSGPPPPPWVLEKNGELLQRGTPEGAGLAAQGAGTSAAMTAAGGVGGRGAVSGSGAGGTSANGPASNSCYFLFLKQRDTITAFPVDMVYSFRPPPRRAALSLDDAEARMRDQRAADSAVPLSLVPKSIKDQAREVAEREGKGGHVSLEAAIASLFGEDDEGGGGGGEDDGLGIALPGRKGKGPGGRGRRAGKGVKNAEGGVLDADEVAEDIYEGLDDDTRAPSKPQQAEDWEHEDYHADDDLAQGEEDSIQKDEDDPGERARLGLEGGDDEDEATGGLKGEGEEDEDMKKLKKRLAEEEGEGEAAEGEDGVADTTKSHAALDDEEDDMDLDALAQGELGALGGNASGATPGTGQKRKASDAGDQAGKRARSATPPPPSMAAPGARGVSAGGTSAAVAARPPGAPPPRPPANGAGAGGASTGSKPPGGSTGAAASTGAKPAGKPAAAAAGAKQAGASTGSGAGLPSADEIAAAIRSAGGSMPLNDIKTQFSKRLAGKGGVEVFKQIILQTCDARKGPDGVLRVTLKPNFVAGKGAAPVPKA